MREKLLDPTGSAERAVDTTLSPRLRSLRGLTAGTPARSSRIPSARLAALHEPQSPIAATAKSQLCRIRWIRLSSTGWPK